MRRVFMTDIDEVISHFLCVFVFNNPSASIGKFFEAEFNRLESKFSFFKTGCNTKDNVPSLNYCSFIAGGNCQIHSFPKGISPV